MREQSPRKGNCICYESGRNRSGVCCLSGNPNHRRTVRGGSRDRVRLTPCAGLLCEELWRAALLAGTTEGDAETGFRLSAHRWLEDHSGKESSPGDRSNCALPHNGLCLRTVRAPRADGGISIVLLHAHAGHVAVVPAVSAATGGQACLVRTRGKRRRDQRIAEQQQQNESECAPHALIVGEISSQRSSIVAIPAIPPRNSRRVSAQAGLSFSA
jgi:hypothetical protein